MLAERRKQMASHQRTLHSTLPTSRPAKGRQCLLLSTRYTGSGGLIPFDKYPIMSLSWLTDMEKKEEVRRLIDYHLYRPCLQGFSAAHLINSILFSLWFYLCGRLVYQQRELTIVFFSLVSSFAVHILLTILLQIISNKALLKIKSFEMVVNSLVSIVYTIASLCMYLTADSKRVEYEILGITSISQEFFFMAVYCGHLAYDLFRKGAGYWDLSQTLSKIGVVQDTLVLTGLLVSLHKGFDLEIDQVVVPIMIHSLFVRGYYILEGIGTSAFHVPVALHHFIFVLIRWAPHVCLLLRLCSQSIWKEKDIAIMEVVQAVVSNILDVWIFTGAICTLRVRMPAEKNEAKPIESPIEEEVCEHSENQTLPPVKDLWKIHGNYYDLRDFVQRHPGGESSICLGQGRDCTSLFEAYHPFTEKHRMILAKYRVATENGTRNGAVVVTSWNDDFYDTLKQRAGEILKGRNTKSSWKRMGYYLFIVSGVCLSFREYVRGHYVWAPFIFALFSWLLGSLGHDGSHFAVSKVPCINDVALLGMSLIASPFMWLHQHTYAHHSHTNQFDSDPDLHHFHYLRLHIRHEYQKYHRLQWSRWYVYFWYIFIVFGEAIYVPLKMMMDGTIVGITDVKDALVRSWLLQIVHFGSYIAAIFVAPFVWGPSVVMASCSLLCFLFCSGCFFGFFSQVNHLNEECISAATPNASGHSWAKEQVETSNNFCTSSPLWFILSNGLNFQIEHHLFPGVNHEHLYLIAPTVKKTCEEFGVNYKSYQSMRDVLDDTARYYQKLAIG